jgi:hypothetical protein
MKLGIPMLVVGVLMLLALIPLSILSILAGFSQTTQGNVSGGVSGYALIAGVVIGLLLTGIGAIRVFKQ